MPAGLLLVLAWIATIVLAIVVDRRVRAKLEQHDQVEPFKVGDRVDVHVDDVPLLTETRVHKLVERAKDESRWAR